MFAGRPVADLIESTLYACRTCGLTFRFPVFAAHEYDELYSEVSSKCWSDESSRTDWALVEEYLSQHVAEGARVLDFGCHTGGLLELLGARYARSGIEVNPGAARITRERTGAEVVSGLELLPPGKRFDVVTAVDVIEHFQDPGRVMSRLLDVLEPQGMLVISTGDARHWFSRLCGARWWYCHYAEHLAFLSERWVRHWLETRGAEARLELAKRFRHAAMPPIRHLVQTCLVPMYLLAPHSYIWAIGAVRRALGKAGSAYAPGGGLTADHLLLVLRKTS